MLTYRPAEGRKLWLAGVVRYAVRMTQPLEPDMSHHDADAAIARAMRAVEAAAPRAAADPTRPVYHFAPPAQYMNDPNGPLWHEGWYHLFYQHNPYADVKGDPHWGHVRSRDLTRWEQLPFALAPARELGEIKNASGTAIVRPDGKVMLVYTSEGSAPSKSLLERPDVWAAVSADDELITWRRIGGNPILTAQVHGELPITRWRDPNHFVLDGRIYLVMSGLMHKPHGMRGVVTLYRAENPQLSQWTFLGILFEHPDDGITGFDCPELFKLGDRWVLVTLHGGINVDCFTGRFDTTTFRFTAEHRDRIDICPRGISASASFWDGNGRRILWTWVRDPGRGRTGNRGWSGCMGLPRVLTMRPDGRLGQEPVPEIGRLREATIAVGEWRLDGESRTVEGVKGDCLEIQAQFEPHGADAYGLIVRRSDDGARGVVLQHDGHEISCSGADPEGIFADLHDDPPLPGQDYQAPLPLIEGEKTLTMHVFLDKCVLEVFLNGRACFTRTIHCMPDDLGVQVFAKGGRVVVKSLRVYTIKPA